MTQQNKRLAYTATTSITQCLFSCSFAVVVLFCVFQAQNCIILGRDVNSDPVLF